jgi:hypothetical protein
VSRPPRIEFAGAVYHVMARGDRREEIFRDDRDRFEAVKWQQVLGGEGFLRKLTLRAVRTTMQYHSKNTIYMCGVMQKNPVSLMGICVLYGRDPEARGVCHGTLSLYAALDTQSGAIEAYRLEAREPAGVRLGGGGDAV